MSLSDIIHSSSVRRQTSREVAPHLIDNPPLHLPADRGKLRERCAEGGRPTGEAVQGRRVALQSEVETREKTI